MGRLNINALFDRAANSAVVWTWIQNGARLAKGLILLPLIVHELSAADLGMYFVLLSLAALVPVIDFGFGPTVDRFISYAMGGAEDIEAVGVPKLNAANGPNYKLLWELLATTRKVYRYLTLILFVILAIWGTYTVELRIHETSSTLVARLAWAATLLSTVFDIYTNWWGTFLRGLNEVRAAARIGVAAVLINCVLAVVLLLCGAGLLSLPVSGLVSSFAQRYFARRRCLALLGSPPAGEKIEIRNMLGVLWPNTWRLGVQFISGYLTVNGSTYICLHKFGLVANSQFGVSVQVMSIASGMAYVWVMTKWPLIGQLRAKHDLAQVQRVLWPRLWLQNLTYVCLAGGVIFLGPTLLQWIGKGKEMLPLMWTLLLGLWYFFDLQFTFWGTLISTENRLPYLWPTVATNVGSFLLTLSLVNFTSLGLGSLVLGPLLAGCIFNYWYWAPVGARGINATFFRFLFLGPSKQPTQPSVR